MLGNVVDLIMGQAPSSKDTNFDGRGIPFVKVGEFGAIRPVIREWTTNPLRMAKRTDVLLCVVGATCGKINLGDECAIGRSVAAIRPDILKLNQLYLYYFMMTLVERLRSGSVGAAQTVISKEMVETLQIPLLPLPEQHRIVAILDEAFENIASAKANAEQNLKNARALFESHLQAVFTQRGEGWVEKRLEQITTLLGDGLHGTPTYTESGDCFFINGNNLNNGKIIFKENTKRVSIAEYDKYKKKLTDRTILVSINGTLGNVAFYNNEKVILGKSACYFNLVEDVDKNFIKYVLISPYFFNYAHKEATGATIKNVSLKTMRELKINIPSIALQQTIVRKLDAVSEETQRLETIYKQKIAALDELKKALLHKAFAGEL